MKKVLSIMCLIITFFVIYFLQADFFSWFTIAGIRPNLFVIFILMIGLFTGKKLGFIFGIICGIYIDLLVGRTVGFSGIVLGIIGFAGEYLDKYFSKESRFTIMMMVIGSTAFFEIATYIYSIIRLGILVEIFSFIKILLIEVMFNAIIIIIIYPLVQKAGHILEDTFKVKTILTQYF